jgi:hypothetical protein
MLPVPSYELLHDLLFSVSVKDCADVMLALGEEYAPGVHEGRGRMQPNLTNYKLFKLTNILSARDGINGTGLYTTVVAATFMDAYANNQFEQIRLLWKSLLSYISDFTV